VCMCCRCVGEMEESKQAFDEVCVHCANVSSDVHSDGFVTA